jgi:hypothetical protein
MRKILLLFIMCCLVFPAGCDRSTSPPMGDYLFLTMRVSFINQVLVGDSTHIFGPVCAMVISPTCTYDPASRSVTFDRLMPFNLYNIDYLLIGGVSFDRFHTCNSTTIIHHYRGDTASSMSPVVATETDGSAIIGIDTAMFRLVPGAVHSVIGRPDTLSGYYYVPPDTTRQPFMMVETPVWMFKNFGYWPISQIQFSK